MMSAGPSRAMANPSPPPRGRAAFRAGVASVLVAWSGLACLTYAGEFDGGIPRDAGPGAPAGFSALDIGTPCQYDPARGGNPTNTGCQAGLTCLLVASDGSYTPFPPGSLQNLTLSVWEDHFTRYRDDGLDEGVCTLIGSWASPPSCPLGTSLKWLATNLAVCVRACQSAAECGRVGDVCDSRFLDVGGGQCVRGCELDIPDCVRSGHVVFQNQDNYGQVIQSAPRFVLAVDDLTGASYCDTASGMCQPNPGQGTKGPGEPCVSTLDCIGGTACVQGGVLRALDPTLPETTQGFCAQPCKPLAQQQFSGGGCNAGYACQAGFTFNHGNALSTDPDAAFALLNLQNTQLLEAGGFCFPDCQANQNCGSYPGTQCGAARDEVFGYAWNQRSMCLVPSLKR